MLKPVTFIPAFILTAFVFSQTAFANFGLKNYEDVRKVCETAGSPIEKQCAQPEQAYEFLKTQQAQASYTPTLILDALYNKQNVFLNCGNVRIMTYNACKPVATNNNQQTPEQKAIEEQKKIADGLACDKKTKHLPRCKDIVISTTQPQKQVVPFESKEIASKTYGEGDNQSVYTKFKNSDGTYTTTVSKDGKDYAQIYEDKNGKVKVTKLNENKSLGEEEIKGQEGKDLKSNYKNLEEKNKSALAKVEEANKCANGKSGQNCDQDQVPPEKKKDVEQAGIDSEQEASKLNQAIQQVYTQLNSVKLTTTQQQTACRNTERDLRTIEDKIRTLKQEQKACGTNSKVAEFICPIIVSPAAQMATTGLNAATALLNGLSTTDTCKITSIANMTSQSLMVVGGITCGITKGKCENKCKSVAENLTTIKSNLESIAPASSSCDSSVPQLISNAAKTAEPLIASATKKHDECDGYKVDVMQMASMAANMGAASAQAKACADKVGLEASSAGLASVSAAAGCNDPSNATYSTQTCVCQRDNTAYGCAGYAGSINGGAVGKIGSASGVSQMAGATTGTKGLNDSGSALDGLGSSDNGWNGIGGNPSAEKQDLAFGKAGGASTSGGGGGGAGGSPSSASGEHLGEEPNKEGLAGKYGNALGGGFGGRGGGATGKAIQNQKYSEAQLAAARRKLASDQASNQVSPASGFSNWDKVKTRYLENKSTLIGN